jgi:hypothetical protein
LEEGIHGGAVNRAEHHRRRCAVAYQLIEEDLSDLPRVNGVREPPLRGKGVVLQPIEQLAAPRADDVGLGVVDVSIDETGDEDAVAVTYNLQICGQIREQFVCWPNRRDVSVTRDQQSILEKLEAAGVVMRARVGTEVQNGTSMRARVCGEVSAERHGRSKLAFRFALPR